MGGSLGSLPGTEMSAAPAVTFRPAGPTDLAACAEIWRAAINDYIGRLGQADIPPETHPVTRLFTHLQATDPERFIVASVPQEHRRAGDAAEGERIVAFGSAIVRERIWYLSMLFVLPEFQGAGLGRDLLARLLPSRRRHGPGDRHGQRPADLERDVRDARHRAPDAAAQPRRTAAPAGGVR